MDCEELLQAGFFCEFVIRKNNSNYRTKLEQRDINIALLTEHTVIVWIFDLLQDAVHERFWRSRF